jgi:site-specific DNA-adenine methylase
MYLRLVKAPFNYSGNKYKLLKQLLPLFPENITDFVDLFGGGFDVGTNVEAERVYYNEIFMPMYEVVKEISTGDLAKIIEQIWGYIQEFEHVVSETFAKNSTTAHEQRFKLKEDIVEMFEMVRK